jgi:hypothetical protein
MWLWSQCVSCIWTVNRAALLLICTKEEQRTVVHCLWVKGRGWNSQAQETEEGCHRMLICCMTMPTIIMLPIPRKPFRNRNLKLSTTHHTVQTLHLLIFIWLDPWRRIWEVTDLQMIMKWRKWWVINGISDDDQLLVIKHKTNNYNYINTRQCIVALSITFIITYTLKHSLQLSWSKFIYIYYSFYVQIL